MIPARRAREEEAPENRGSAQPLPAASHLRVKNFEILKFAALPREHVVMLYELYS